MIISRSGFVLTSRRALSGSVLGVLALACQAESVDLGGDTLTRDLVSGARCAESPRIEGNVLVSDQAELAALAGCEVIAGDLIVRLYEGADFAPLGQLRVVEGDFALGVDPDRDAVVGFLVSDQFDEQRELIERGWVASLDGLQSLESVGALFLRGLPGEDLSAFSSLSSVGSVGSDIDGFLDGYIILQQNRNLRSLAGLEQVRDARGFVVSLSPALTSLNGFAPTDRMLNVSVFSSPLLSDLAALAPLANLEALTLSGTGVVDLDALSALRTLQSLDLIENPALVDMTGLAGLEGAETISILGNAALERLPSFTSFTTQPNALRIAENAVLRDLTLDFENAETPTYLVPPLGGEPGPAAALLLGIDVIDIGGNPSLQTLSFSSGLRLARLLMVHGNDALRDVDMGSIEELGHLIIADNTTLSSVQLGELQAVPLLQVTNNPNLSSAVFDELPTFNRLVFDNAD